MHNAQHRLRHQFTGRSSVEMYRQCLLAGCRCVELDFWNGRTDEPVIVHGYTLVPEISAKDVIESIAESAFKTSEWPVVLSFENHCGPRQQAKIASYCREFFGDMLLDSPLETFKLEPNNPLPPPSSLKRKIIIKNKKKHRTHHHHHKKNAQGGESQFHVDLNQTGEPRHTEMQGNGEIPRPPLEKEGSRESSEEENEVANGEIPDGGALEEVESSSSEEDEGPPTPDGVHPRERTSSVSNLTEGSTANAEEEAGAEISALVNYVQPVHFHSFEVSGKRGRSYEMSSFVETQASNLLKESPMEFVNYNKRQLSRVYPRGTRVDSSNFLPHQFWNAGCQLVALNYQSLDLAMQLNLGIFEFNNRSGYLLKPDFMRRPDRRFDPFAESTVDGIIAGTVSVKRSCSSGRQNSISAKGHMNTKTSDDKPEREKESSLTLLETSKLVIEAESLEKLWSGKIVKDKKLEFDKSLEKLRKKHEKERQNQIQQHEKKRGQIQKSHTKLVKKLSSNKPVEPTGREATQDLNTVQEELESRLQEEDKLHKTSLCELSMEHLIAEKKLQEKYHDTIYAALDKAMKMSQAEQLKKLQTIHDKQVEDIKRRTEEQHREKRKGLGKTTVDKEELSRIKREISKQIVAEGIQERQKLTDIHEKKKTELEKQHEDVRAQFEEDKQKARNNIDLEYEEKRTKLEEGLSS
ncbi:1-phosphatidylinositol 4,5-bisphosphate phosphodiesterase classes I and II-like [Penaeus chinensis]|uniref:1-phosphatidylinositol 4,5-bisphosphate phosphodiesterase classes I and II-like n=1 Tax=Penaeus chinensis TaxID=139456 RepID=UPI001FB81214|nr:1-phosphatidylinositol 4,5-bisphosphate phosphodiesterase classes I and II-like [Penaeus chinensis]